jgi:ketosteroid isomerase-like protein
LSAGILDWDHAVSQQNIEIVRRSNALFNDRNWEQLLELYEPDIEIRDRQHAPDLPEVLHGVEAARRFLAYWVEPYEEFGAEVLEYIDVDPWVVTDTRWHGRGKGSDVPVEIHSGDAVELRNGKIARMVVGYPDVASAPEAVSRSRRTARA